MATIDDLVVLTVVRSIIDGIVYECGQGDQHAVHHWPRLHVSRGKSSINSLSNRRLGSLMPIIHPIVPDPSLPSPARGDRVGMVSPRRGCYYSSCGQQSEQPQQTARTKDQSTCICGEGAIMSP